MRQENDQTRSKKILYILAGLAGISLVIIIHEMGHLLFAIYFGVPAPIFSLGFGPVLFSIPIGETAFQIALLPLGGYVDLDQDIFATKNYAIKILITVAGIIFNLIFAYAILAYYAVKNRVKNPETATPIIETHNDNNNNKTIIGPIGIIQMIGNGLAVSVQQFWLMIGLVSLNVGFFNLLPLPFFDGGKALIITIENITGKTISHTLLWYISIIFITLFMLFITKITTNDIKRLQHR